jgi:hypothetical protein
MKNIKPMPENLRGKIYRIRDKLDGVQWVRYWGADPECGALCEKSAPVDVYLQEFPGHPIEVWSPGKSEVPVKQQDGGNSNG